MTNLCKYTSIFSSSTDLSSNLTRKNHHISTLSAHALAALKSFEAEKDEHQAKFQKLKAEAENNALLSIDAFSEDWNESQFWVR
jgi:hypothetical protein